jgi:hypothetical protein
MILDHFALEKRRFLRVTHAYEFVEEQFCQFSGFLLHREKRANFKCKL